jgi:hypothetical protein
VIALLVAAFIVYLYTPHLLFKFAAATKYDLVTRKDLPQVEEFFAAGLPSFFLNLFTWAVLRAAYWLAGTSPITIDRFAAAEAFKKEPDLSAYVTKGNLAALACYLGALAFLSWWAGRAYGGVIRKIALAGGENEYIQLALHATFPWNRQKLWPKPVRVLLAIWRGTQVLYRRGWRIFYSHYEHPLYPIALRSSYAFVHTTHGLYHGILYQFDKKQDGDVEGIILVDVSRFSRKTEAECLRLGINPISDLSGPLFIKWGEIIDINYPPSDDVLEQKRKFYDQQLLQHANAKATRRKRLSSYVAFLRR